MEKKSAYIISLIFLVMGLFFLVNSQANITGAVIGASATPPEAGFFAGAALILTSFILFAVSIGGLEKKIIITNSINKISAIQKLYDQSRKDPVVARGFDHLIEELKKGNLSPGKRYRHLGGKLNELKGAKARLYFLKTDKGYNIIGGSSKKLQTKTINKLNSYISEGRYG